MLLFLIYLIVALGACYWLYKLSIVAGYAGLAMLMIIPLFIWRMMQSVWKQKIWAMPVWIIISLPMIAILLSVPDANMLWGILAAWTLIIAAMATILSYRNGQPLLQTP